MRNHLAIQRASAWAVFLLMFSAPVASSDQDLFKYEKAWALAGPCCGDSGHDIAVEPDGSFFIVGNDGALDLDSDGRADATIKAENGILVASYNSSGKMRWARVAASARDITGSAIVVTAEGAAHVAGHYAGADVDLDGDGRVDLPAPGAEGAPFLAHFDPGGRLISAFAILGPGNNRIGNLTHAANGDLVASGYTQGSIDLDADGKADVVSTESRQTPYDARFDRKGTLIWVRAFQQKERLAILDLTSSADHIAVSGLYKGHLDLDQDGRPDAAADPDGNSEGFVAILGNDGAIRQVLAITGPGADQPRGVAFSPDGRSLSLTGFVRLTADFDGDGVPEGGVRCDNDGDIVWARYQLRLR